MLSTPIGHRGIVDAAFASHTDLVLLEPVPDAGVPVVLRSGVRVVRGVAGKGLFDPGLLGTIDGASIAAAHLNTLWHVGISGAGGSHAVHLQGLNLLHLSGDIAHPDVGAGEVVGHPSDLQLLPPGDFCALIGVRADQQLGVLRSQSQGLRQEVRPSTQDDQRDLRGDGTITRHLQRTQRMALAPHLGVIPMDVHEHGRVAPARRKVRSRVAVCGLRLHFCVTTVTIQIQGVVKTLEGTHAWKQLSAIGIGQFAPLTVKGCRLVTISQR
mmetsp:Transcript_17875/g.30245  ORF Transcript_17875/g.30245 Transcript_17875/m.30245 type:complete len:269 (+) Transcript_17875:1615-2421(+)